MSNGIRVSEQLPALRTTASKRALVDLRAALFRRDAALLAGRLRAGELSLANWQREMKWMVKDLQVTSAVAANGGNWGAMTPAEWGYVGADCKKQYRFLARFAQDIAERAEKGLELTTAVDTRAKLYGGAGNKTFHSALSRAEGWPKLPAMPGDFECDGNCGCHWEVTHGPDGWECHWVMDPVKEHCDGCMAAAGQWNPLVIPY